MKSSITVSGNIVGELSEKIPSIIVALNELIKNSYDAGANNIKIKLDNKSRKLIISDDGSGMNKEDIDALFHISNSKKVYGEINKYGRRTQGSKGLGFLSVFKFGNYVIWKTNKDTGLMFSVDYNNIINSEDLYGYNIEIIEDSSIAKGTEIEILLDEYNLNYLNEYLKEEKNYEKIINAFIDDDVNISIVIDGKILSKKLKIDLKNYNKVNQLYYIEYSSQKQEIKYYYNNILILSYPYKFSSHEYELEINMEIFQFKKGGGGKSNISKLFYNRQNDLTPLIYINSNLFNNYTIFDPNIMKNIKLGDTLNQMIGFIKIESNSKKINFNSDRTQFLQNEVTDGIIEFLKNINKFIQKEGSKYKKHLVKFDILKTDKIKASYLEGNTETIARDLIKDTFAFKDKVKISVENNTINYSIFGKKVSVMIQADESKKEKTTTNINLNSKNKVNRISIDIDKKDYEIKKLYPAKLSLKQSKIKAGIPSKQINLYDYVDNAVNSEGEKIDLHEIDIKVNGEILKNGILQSVNVPCEKNVEYSYLDSNTGLIIDNIVIKFYEHKSKIACERDEKCLIYIPAKKTYKINYNDVVGNLIKQINSLKLEDYREMISCSIRAVFEISVDTLKKSQKFVNIFIGTKKLEDRVVKVIEYISKENKFMSAISISTEIDYDSLKNLVNPTDFKLAIEKANLAAHKANTYVSDIVIQHLAKEASIFVIIINEMINNDKIN